MGFLKPTLPALDYRHWRTQPRSARIKLLVQHWATEGFGAPSVVHALYIVKIIGYVAGAIFVISLTPGLGSVASVESWWTEPPTTSGYRATTSAPRPHRPDRARTVCAAPTPRRGPFVTSLTQGLPPGYNEVTVQ